MFILVSLIVVIASYLLVVDICAPDVNAVRAWNEMKRKLMAVLYFYVFGLLGF